MKNPEKIKKGLECCTSLLFDCPQCSYYVVGDCDCVDEVKHDALAYIQQLEAKVEGLERVRADLTATNMELRDVVFKNELFKRRLEEERSEFEARVPRWISVEERLPESKTPAYENDMSNAVLLYTPVDGYVHIGWYVRKDYRGRDVWHTLSAMRSHQMLTKKVTHWMPLPERPKEE